MNKKTFLLIPLLAVSFSTVSASDTFCTRCDKVRDYHKNNPSNYEYYEDYIDDVESGKVQEKDPDEVMSQILFGKPAAGQKPLFRKREAPSRRYVPFRKINKENSVTRKEPEKKTRTWLLKRAKPAEG